MTNMVKNDATVPVLNEKFRKANISYSIEEKEAMEFRAKEAGKLMEKLLVWGETGELLWRYTEFEIAQNNNLHYEIEYISFETEQEALAECAERKLAIPTINLFQKVEAGLPFGEFWRDRYGEDHPLCKAALHKFDVIDTLGIVGIKAGTSRVTVSKVKKILNSNDEALIEKCRNGEISISAADDMIKESEVPTPPEGGDENPDPEVSEQEVMTAEEKRNKKKRVRETNALAKFSIDGFSNGKKLNDEGREFFMLRWNEDYPENEISEEEIVNAIKNYGNDN